MEVLWIVILPHSGYNLSNFKFDNYVNTVQELTSFPLDGLEDGEKNARIGWFGDENNDIIKETWPYFI